MMKRMFKMISKEAPWRYTGMRYLGDFKHYKDGNPIAVIYEE
jgi:hypothetical protein